MARQRNLKAPAHHRALHGGDDRQSKRFQSSKQLSVLSLLGGAAEFTDISAREKSAALAAQQHGANARHRGQGPQRPIQAGAHGSGYGVYRRAVDDDDSDFLVPIYTDNLLFQHVRSASFGDARIRRQRP